MPQHYRMPMNSRSVLTAGLGLAAIILSQPVWASDALRVTIDKNHVLRTDRPVETIIVGNPHIADVSAQSNQLLFVLGRTSGETNILGFDKEGNVVFDKDVTVVPRSSRSVTLHRGAVTETFACAPRCESELHPGDDPKAFTQVQSQTSGAVGLAKGQASSDSGGGE